MSGDVYMRADAACRHNLAIGEPEALREALRLPASLDSWDPSYPMPAGDDRLLGVLRELYGSGRRYVVANGAKQALAAAVYAVSKLERKDGFAVPSPYWPSFPTIARQLGLEFVDTCGQDTIDVTCLAIPNNPSGWVQRKLNAPVDVWDAAYAHPVYGFLPTDEPPHRIKVQSAGKLLGLPGLRVGWLSTEDDRLADAAAEYIEATTSGVAGCAQAIAATALLDAQTDYHQHGYELAREDLVRNASNFKRLLFGRVEHIEGLPGPGGQGMFAWFHAIRPELFETARVRAGVALVPGSACGERRSGWWRMSLGGNPDKVLRALEDLDREMERLEQASALREES